MLKRIGVFIRLFLIGLIFFSACAPREEPRPVLLKDGDTVKVNYTGRFDDGEIFDTSVGKEPLQITIGKKQVVTGFEDAVVTMKVGETRTVKLPPEKAYGQLRKDLTQTVPRQTFPFKPQVGQQLMMNQPNGKQVQVRVTDVTDTTVTLDANHPLAGKTLNFEITLIEVK